MSTVTWPRIRRRRFFREADPPVPTQLFEEIFEDMKDAVPFPPDFTFSFLSLPSDVRLYIYQILFRRNIPIYPTVGKRERRTTFPTNFLLANRQVHTEATQVLWGQNKIVLQFPLQWKRSTSYWSYWGTPPHLADRPSVPRICETFIPSNIHLHQIHDLVIEVYLLRYSGLKSSNVAAFPATRVHQDLASLCKKLKFGHGLRSLEVRFSNVCPRSDPTWELMDWSNGMRHYSENGGQVQSSCCVELFGSLERRRLGLWQAMEKEWQAMEKLCKQAIKTDQQVLIPLTMLRGVGSVKMTGRISEEWARYLKMSIESPEGSELEAFKHDVPPTWYKDANGKRKKSKGVSKWEVY